MKYLRRIIKKKFLVKNILKRILWFGFLCHVGFSVYAANSVLEKDKSQYKLQLKSFFQTIDNNYAPLKFKENLLNFNWGSLKENYLRKINNFQDSYQFNYLTSDILSNFNDAHVSIALPSTLTKKLPFQIMYVENKYLVNFISDQLNNPVCSVEIGDELVQYENEDLEKIQKKYSGYNKYGNDLTNKSIFALKITNMDEISGNRHISIVPEKVKLKFRSNATNELYDCELFNKVEGVGLISRPVNFNTLKNKSDEINQKSFEFQIKNAFKNVKSKIEFNQNQLNKLHSTHLKILKINKLLNSMISMNLDNSNNISINSNSTKGIFFEIGKKEPFFKLPSNFKIIDPGDFGLFLNSDGFFAGTFEKDNMRIGFLRIPSYMPTLTFSMNIGLRYYIQKLKENSDFLIFDQTNNPGGLVVYSDLVIKSLVGQINKSTHMKYLVKPTQNFLRTYAELKDEIVRDAEKILTNEEKHKLSLELEEDYKKIYYAYANNLDLSEPISMLPMTEFIDLALDRSFDEAGLKDLSDSLGVELTKHQFYEKPIFMLINHFDFSAGDSVPAILQDNKRVTLLGTRTAGAGGTVESFSSVGKEPFTFQLTTSLMTRANGQFVENLGVLPDYHFEINSTDIRDNFTNYLNRVVEFIKSNNPKYR